MRVMVTGGTGLVGQSLIGELVALSYNVTALVRNPTATLDENVKRVIVSDYMNNNQALSDLGIFQNIDVIVHLAARVHIMNDSNSDPLIEFRKINTQATLNLAKQAAEAGVKRFVFISSVKVNGELTLEQPFSSEDKYIPTDPYGRSKYEAEQGLLALAKETGMEMVIIRPPLVYGPGVKANFLSMMKWVDKGIPLPLGAIDNKRSFIALDNLVHFIIHCIDHPKAANEIFLISDGEDVSTTELLQKVANAFGKKSALIPISVGLMTLTAKLLGKGDIASRLFSSLQLDSSKARELLQWQPVITMDEQLKKTAEHYRRFID